MLHPIYNALPDELRALAEASPNLDEVAPDLARKIDKADADTLMAMWEHVQEDHNRHKAMRGLIPILAAMQGETIETVAASWHEVDERMHAVMLRIAANAISKGYAAVFTNEDEARAFAEAHADRLPPAPPPDNHYLN